MGETFVADVHGTQRVWAEPPGLSMPTEISPKAPVENSPLRYGDQPLL
jgi:hypothetical protein